MTIRPDLRPQAQDPIQQVSQPQPASWHFKVYTHTRRKRISFEGNLHSMSPRTSRTGPPTALPALPAPSKSHAVDPSQAGGGKTFET